MPLRKDEKWTMNRNECLSCDEESLSYSSHGWYSPTLSNLAPEDIPYATLWLWAIASTLELIVERYGSLLQSLVGLHTPATSFWAHFSRNVRSNRGGKLNWHGESDWWFPSWNHNAAPFARITRQHLSDCSLVSASQVLTAAGILQIPFELLFIVHVFWYTLVWDPCARETTLSSSSCYPSSLPLTTSYVVGLQLWLLLCFLYGTFKWKVWICLRYSDLMENFNYCCLPVVHAITEITH